ncbi:hypothetical protein OEZ86_010158 [Tetradesmus obliquus]|nr:hypothetical protein OEZ86_010158 [Tetradesmus obliquus]
MPSLLELTADELISRGIAPVKKEFIMPFNARKQVEAVTSSATAAETSTVSAKKKSKGQIKRERSESSKAELCTNFALGRCSYGASCRFSHDTAAYLASKLPDLPGSCPFTLQEACPYGVTCRSYLAPLTTVGNLPFRRLCVGLGCEVTCGEMALATNLLQGQASEWALLKRHPCEKLFGVQVCGGYPDAMSHLAQLLEENISTDFVDINCGCPIDIICERGAGSALLTRPKRLEQVVRATTACIHKPVIVKIRKGYYDNADIAHNIIPHMRDWGAAAVTLHGRSRQQRYSRAADWEYIRRCADTAAEAGLPLVGNGDVFSYSEWAARLATPGVATAMIGRAALIKPWIFTEITEQRLWDISAAERLELLKSFASHGLEHWGSDSRGVEATRRFLLEWLSFTHRYIPVGLLEVTPQLMQWRPPAYRGRNELETLLASESAADWVRISEMLLGPAPPGFTFAPKHKSNAYAVSADAVAQVAGAAAGTEAAANAAGDAGDDEQENG